MPTSNVRRWLHLAVLLAVAALLALWWFRSRKPDAASAPEASAADTTPESDTEDAPRPRATPPSPASHAPLASAHTDDHEGDADDRHPHPITPEHVRIHNDNQMIGALNDATDVKDPARLRQLIDAWKAKHHDDPEKYAEAYTVIADCLEFPGDESRARARRFYDENRASTLRRHIRRHCF